MGMKTFARDRKTDREADRERESRIWSSCFSSTSEVTVRPANPQITTSAQQRAIRAITIFCPCTRWQTCCQSSSSFTELIAGGVTSPCFYKSHPRFLLGPRHKSRRWQRWILWVAANEKPRWSSQEHVSDSIWAGDWKKRESLQMDCTFGDLIWN